MPCVTLGSLWHRTKFGHEILFPIYVELVIQLAFHDYINFGKNFHFCYDLNFWQSSNIVDSICGDRGYVSYVCTW